MVETTMSAPPARCSRGGRVAHLDAEPCERRAARVSSARDFRRAPAPRSPAPRGRPAPGRSRLAVAPPPRTTADTSGDVVRSRIAAAAPGRSVLSDPLVSASARPSSSVLTAPARRARSVSRSDEAERLALERHGQRQPPPVIVEPRPGRPRGRPAGTRCGVVGPVEPELGVAGPVQDRRQRVGDRVAQHGRGTPQQRSEVSQ